TAIPAFRVGLSGRPRFEARFEQSVVDELRESGLGRIAFGELLTRSLARTGASAPNVTETKFAEFLLSLFNRGLVEFWAAPPPFATAAGPRPTVSPLARALAEDGTWLSTLSMQPFDASAPDVRELVKLSDGTRDRAALAEELANRISGLADPNVTVDRLL